MEGKYIEIGKDYEICRGWSGRRRVRILENRGYGIWRARYVRDKYSYGTAGDELQVESRNLRRPWVEARAEYEQKDLLEREWQRARKQADRQSEKLTEELSEFGVELEYTSLDHREDGLPGEPTVSLAMPLAQLKRLTESLKQGEIQAVETPNSALSELI